MGFRSELNTMNSYTLYNYQTTDNHFVSTQVTQFFSVTGQKHLDKTGKFKKHFAFAMLVSDFKSGECSSRGEKTERCTELSWPS